MLKMKLNKKQNYFTHQIGNVQNVMKNKYWWEHICEKCPHCWWMCLLVKTVSKGKLMNRWIKDTHIFLPSNSIYRCIPLRNSWMYAHIKTYSKANSSTVYNNKNWKYPKYPLLEDQMSQFWYVYIQEHQTVFNANEWNMSHQYISKT